jgi:hypothetical protein
MTIPTCSNASAKLAHDITKAHLLAPVGCRRLLVNFFDVAREHAIRLNEKMSSTPNPVQPKRI